MAKAREHTVLWLDGCFDGFHYAHANAIRQALALVSGPVKVVVGVHSDAEIERNKGPPLFDEEERYALIAGCRWISRVVENVPYTTQSNVFDKYNVDFIVHGDDPAIDADGNDCYAVPKALGKYLECKRTPGISTTSLIQRVLHPILLTEVHLLNDKPLRQLLASFAASCKPPLPIFDALDRCATRNSLPEKACAYIASSWDCFCSAHIQIFKKAKDTAIEKSGTDVSLIVGVWSDEVVEAETHGKSLLIMLERSLAVAQCKYVDGIVLNASRTADEDFLASIGVAIVITNPGEKALKDTDNIRYVELPSSGQVREAYTVSRLRSRVLEKQKGYEERQRRKGY